LDAASVLAFHRCEQDQESHVSPVLVLFYLVNCLQTKISKAVMAASPFRVWGLQDILCRRYFYQKRLDWLLVLMAKRTVT
jgi:hypothetical protein